MWIVLPFTTRLQREAALQPLWVLSTATRRCQSTKTPPEARQRKESFTAEQGVSGRAVRSTRGTISPCSTVCLLALQSPTCSLQAVRAHPLCPTKTEHSTPKSFPPPSTNASLHTAKHPPQAQHGLDSVITGTPVPLTVV